ncbi:hypothetical protein [Notoacmeibacter ruber]|uniref:SRPBCC family protein n=1 Tax=Notoacmeibacter ruber TaxID=2670375 RepID=A0A3L7JF59_9HYPH|nr:hypothetical protein [Notoacmeibacter ruber]RLQ88959.1 hypothetical protein D8780_12680 [Notoacmeibacter ruber]
MERIVTVEAFYDRDPDVLFGEALDLAELKRAMEGLATYEGLPDRPLVEGDRFKTTVTLFGFLKNDDHIMQVEVVDHRRKMVRSRESSPSFQRWDHTLTIEPHRQGALWRDRVIVDTGWTTPISARICRHLYRYRHRRRQALRIDSSIERAP